jgi:hypothetical protein
VYHQHIVNGHLAKVRLASDLATLAAAGGTMPSEVLTNYDAIRLMTAVNAKPNADAEILRLLE